MKKTLIRTLAIVAFVAAVSTTSQAQFSLGLQGGIAKSNVEDSKTVAGGGVNLRVFTSPRFAVGVAGKIYADGSDYTFAGQTLSSTGTLTPVTGTLDYYFAEGLLRPYIGGDAGVYFSKYNAKFNGNTIVESSRHSNFGAAPRAGLLFAFGNMGIQVEGIYHFVFGNKNHRSTTGNADNIDFESTSQFGGVNVGIIFGLGGK
ncbi:outer membrane beta-barrel protein [Dyadobacter aurulentus]|uniref:outer membrane beta-barrel protein n=1 Tax=Dyadobacter sp. UC 10 TaxID=2605428 RepID=UPI0011F22C78|nr:outer membrane beta-barrel protein [Dyadobacter sp. UC 10]KAA0993433.1 outer membrane beta-barrel protein [Dyadobacter sp. UC 10]